MGKKVVRASVREVAEFSLRSGSIEKGRTSVSYDDAMDGTKCHVEFQSKMSEEHGSENFKSEIFLKYEAKNSEIVLKISGRIDGVLYEGNSICIYEIKSTSKDPESIEEDEFPVHWAQAECYAKMLLEENENDNVKIRLVYINRETRLSKQYERIYTRQQVDTVFSNLVEPYLEWMSGVRKWEF